MSNSIMQSNWFKVSLMIFCSLLQNVLDCSTSGEPIARSSYSWRYRPSNLVVVFIKPFENWETYTRFSSKNSNASTWLVPLRQKIRYPKIKVSAKRLRT